MQPEDSRSVHGVGARNREQEILGIALGGPTMIIGFMHMAAGTHDAMKRVLFGCAGVTGGLATPGCINWLVASARDANLFA